MLTLFLVPGDNIDIKEAYLYSAYYEILISRRSSMARVLARDHTVLPATHTFIHKWNEPYPPLTPSRRATPPSPHFGWYSFPIPLRVGG